MGTCCSTDSRPVNADVEVNNMSLKPINPPKNRQAHSRATDQDLPQGVSNPETKAQEIELLLQQTDQEGHRSGGKSNEVHEKNNGHYGGEERRPSYRENDRYYEGRHGEREERYRDDDRYNNDSRVEQRDRNERSIREDRPGLKENEYAVSEQNVLTEVVEKPAPEDGHHEAQLTVEEVIGEEEHGVTYYINANTQGLIRIHVAASEAKSNIQEIEAKIKSQNENLRSISISFNGQETENMDYFITKLLKTSTYTSINIVFGKLSTFSEQGLQAFSDIIANSSLEKLYIMHASHDATDSFFATVMPAVQSCKATLKELSIQSGNCQELSDDAIKHIAKAIEWNQVLEYVAFYFGNTTHLTDNAISELRFAFNLKAQLKKLELGFLNLAQLTDEALVSFCEIVESLHNLVDVSIITPGAGFSPAKYQKFEAVINNFKVQNVNLYWDD